MAFHGDQNSLLSGISLNGTAVNSTVTLPGSISGFPSWPWPVTTTINDHTHPVDSTWWPQHVTQTHTHPATEQAVREAIVKKLAENCDTHIRKALTKEEGEPMRGLYEVFVVDPESGTVESMVLVAKDEGTARLKAAIKLDKADDLDDLDIIVRRIGDVRCKKKVQEVKVVK